MPRISWERFGPMGPPAKLLEKARFMVRVLTIGLRCPFHLKNWKYPIKKGTIELKYLRNVSKMVVMHPRFVVMLSAPCLRKKYLVLLRKRDRITLSL